MTSIADTSRRTGWQGRLVWIVLALSLTLNVFFIGGLLWVRIFLHPFPPPMQRIERLGRSLSLNDTQRDAFDQFLRVIELHGRFTRETNDAVLDQIWGELSKPTPNDATVLQLTNEIYSNRTAFQKEASGSLMAFIKTLNPAQRNKMERLVRGPQQNPTHRLFEIIVP
jgi:uncharacterized membrane protein